MCSLRDISGCKIRKCYTKRFKSIKNVIPWGNIETVLCRIVEYYSLKTERHMMFWLNGANSTSYILHNSLSFLVHLFKFTVKIPHSYKPLKKKYKEIRNKSFIQIGMNGIVPVPNMPSSPIYPPISVINHTFPT